METDHRVEVLKQRMGSPLGLIEVGARWGIGSRWDSLIDVSQMICFDPDPDECDRLNAASPETIRYLPFGLAEVDGDYVLHVTREPACSSLYSPRRAIYERYPCLDIIRPEVQATIPCRRLDDVLREVGFARVDAIKLDTQGSELPIMRGGPGALATALFIEVEVEFNALYEGQPLFHEVDAFMRGSGFALWRFENLVHYSTRRDETARQAMLIAGDPDDSVSVVSPGGQLFWAQAIYVRSELLPAETQALDARLGCRAGLLALAYGAPDLARTIIERTGDAALIAAFAPD